MIERPRFRYSYHVEAMEPEYVMLLTERQVFVLEGHAYKQMAPLLNGERTVDEIVEALEGKVEAPQIYYALDVLERKGYLVEGGAGPAGQAAFWDAAGAKASEAQARMSGARVEVRGVGVETRFGMEGALESLGASVVSGGGEFLVVVADDYGRGALSEINKQSLAGGRPWMLVKPVGTLAWLGPIFVPGKTGCWECLNQRLRGNRQVESYIQQRKGSQEPLVTSLGWLPTSVGVAVNLAATEAARWLALGRNERLLGKLLTLDLVSLETREHVLVKRPQCPACGEVPTREAGPVVLQSRKKRYMADGGHRVEPPAETFERLKHHISPITGVVSSLERLSKDDGDLVCAYSAGHNFAMITDTLFFLRQNLRGQSGGKGMTDVQARVSGICEAMERYSGVYRGDEPVRRSSFRELEKEGAVHPNDCMRFSASQYANRTAWNTAQANTKFHIVPELFEEESAIDWTPAWSMTHERVVYVPAAYCYYGHPDLRRRFFCTADANGNAAGSTLEEAVLQGFMELVERDAVAQWWYNRIPRPAIDLDSFDEPYLSALRDYYKRINREYWALDITSDLGIPTFVGVSRRTDRPVEDIVIGFGAHFDPRVALLRALTEVNQFFPAVSKVNPDGSTKYWFHDVDAINWWKTATIANQPYVAPEPGAAPRRKGDFVRHDGDDLRDDVLACVEIARKSGLEVLVVDQTRPDVGVSAAKVIVPGLRHFWRRLGPGRLYDVPLKLGWLKSPIAETEMNPIGIFF